MPLFMTLRDDTPTPGDPGNPGDSGGPGEVRRDALASLAEELRLRGQRTLVALSSSDHPVLYTERGGRRVAVVVVQVGGSWHYVWGRTDQVSAESPELAAQFLSADPARQRFAARRDHLKAVA